MKNRALLYVIGKSERDGGKEGFSVTEADGHGACNVSDSYSVGKVSVNVKGYYISGEPFDYLLRRRCDVLAERVFFEFLTLSPM